MSRMSISMCENDGVPSVSTIASACAASAARSDELERPARDAVEQLVGARLLERHPAARAIASSRSASLSTPSTRQAAVGEAERERQADAAEADDGDVVAPCAEQATARAAPARPERPSGSESTPSGS